MMTATSDAWFFVAHQPIQQDADHKQNYTSELPDPERCIPDARLEIFLLNQGGHETLIKKHLKEGDINGCDLHCAEVAGTQRARRE